MGQESDALHPLIRAAGREAQLPSWAVMSENRRGHADRVARLMKKWAKARALVRGDRIRWRAAGLLHDVLKGVSPARLREEFGFGSEWPDPVLHGPACAVRLRQEGVDDTALLRAIAHHTTGHVDFELLGESLYIADFIEPGRPSRRSFRRELRARMPDGQVEVLTEVAAAKIRGLIDRRLQIPDVTVQFWSGVLAER